ncbi:MAG TPA: sporulation protein Cse60 [Haloplasmataceae bacterium]
MAVKVKLFDEEHELDLEEKVNAFLANIQPEQLIDIKYQVATMYDYKNQIYCYSAMIIYKEEDQD